MELFFEKLLLLMVDNPYSQVLLLIIGPVLYASTPILKIVFHSPSLQILRRDFLGMS